MNPQLGFVLALVACTALFLLLALRTSRIAKPSPSLEPTHPPITQKTNNMTHTYRPNMAHPSQRLDDFWADFDAIEFDIGERHAEAYDQEQQDAADYGDAHQDDSE